MNQGNLSSSNNTKVKLRLEDGSEYPIEGNLAFSGASVDPETGTVTLRAVFSNPNHLLLPGMYATAKIVQAVIPNAMLIPQAAITRLPTGQAVAMIVNAKGLAESRPVQTAGVQGKDWIVTSGIQAGERVIVEGIAKVKEGQKVNPKPLQPQAAAQGSNNAKPAQQAKPQAEQNATSNT